MLRKLIRLKKIAESTQAGVVLQMVYAELDKGFRFMLPSQKEADIMFGVKCYMRELGCGVATRRR